MRKITRIIGEYIFRTELVIIIYLSFRCIQILYSVINQIEESNIIIVRLVALLVMTTLCYLTYKQHKIATWINCIILFISGFGSVVIGVALISFNQICLKLLFVILGAYFTLGSVLILKRRKQQTHNPALNIMCFNSDLI